MWSFQWWSCRTRVFPQREFLSGIVTRCTQDVLSYATTVEETSHKNVCVCVSLLEVRKRAHELIANLLKWSLSVSTSGTFPSRGFQGEQFDKSTIRFRKQGGQLACGWRFRVWRAPIPNDLQALYIGSQIRHSWKSCQPWSFLKILYASP